MITVHVFEDAPGDRYAHNPIGIVSHCQRFALDVLSGWQQIHNRGSPHR